MNSVFKVTKQTICQVSSSWTKTNSIHFIKLEASWIIDDRLRFFEKVFKFNTISVFSINKLSTIPRILSKISMCPRTPPSKLDFQ